MSSNSHEILRDGLMLGGAVAVGLVTAWLIIKLQKPESSAEPWWAPAPAVQQEPTKPQ
jgi:hypothetical protein